jgi:hypothetical protein
LFRRKIEAALKKKIDSDMSSGALPAGTDAAALAGHIRAVIQGMSTLARDGAKRDKLKRVMETAMRAWHPLNYPRLPSLPRRGGAHRALRHLGCDLTLQGPTTASSPG